MLVVVSVFLLFLVGSLLFVFTVRRQNEDRSVQFLWDATQQRKDAVQQQVQGDQQVLRGLAVALSGMDLSDEESIMDLLDTVNRTNTFVRMGLADERGRVDLVDLQGTRMDDVDMSESWVYQRALSGHEAVSPTFYESRSGEYVNYYTVPVMRGGEVVGVVCAVNREEVLKRVIAVPVLQGAGYFAVIDSTGTIMAPTVDPNPAVEVGASVFDAIQFRAGDDRSRMERALVYGQKEEFLFDMQGEEHLSVVLPLQVNDWYVLSVVPRDAVFTYYNQTAVGIVVIIGAACMVFLFLLYRQMRTMNKSREELERLAYTDLLTGARNYNRFVLDAAAILEQDPEGQYALWALDIKKFNTLNELFGNRKGDQVLQRMADVLARADGKDPVGVAFCRIAADQFAGIRPYKEKEDLSRWFQKVYRELSERRQVIPHNRMRIDLAMGYYCPADFAENPAVGAMVSCAAIAKKEAKEQAGTAEAFFNGAMGSLMRWEAELEAGGADALEHEDIHFYLQPKVSIQGGYHIRGAEVLARWVHPKYGFISPTDFIPLFEGNGFVVEMDRYIFEHACGWYAEAREEGCPPIRLAVNVSRQGLLRDDFISHYVSVKERYGIEDGVLELEFTESVIQENYTLFKGTIMELQRYGFMCSIDDFGAGYSSLNVLKNLPIDVLKLDAAFFRDGLGTTRDQIVVGDFIAMAKKLSIHTVAEGVETPEQVAFLQQAGCDLIQGFIFAKPLPVKEFLELLQKNDTELFLNP